MPTIKLTNDRRRQLAKFGVATVIETAKEGDIYLETKKALADMRYVFLEHFEKAFPTSDMENLC